jgi:hypothetical protein
MLPGVGRKSDPVTRPVFGRPQPLLLLDARSLDGTADTETCYRPLIHILLVVGAHNPLWENIRGPGNSEPALKEIGGYALGERMPPRRLLPGCYASVTVCVIVRREDRTGLLQHIKEQAALHIVVEPVPVPVQPFENVRLSGDQAGGEPGEQDQGAQKHG